MTETTLALPVLASRLATSLAATLAAHADSAQSLTAYRGVLTPSRLDAPERETAALISGAAVHDLGWLRRVAVHGEDRFRWLSGMVTNSVNEIPLDGDAWNLVLNAQGRILGDVTVSRDGDHLELVIAADQQEKLLAHLEHFIVMDDVELVALGEETALGVIGPQAADVLSRMGLPAPAEPMTATRTAWNGFDLRIHRGYGVLAPHYEIWADAPAVPLLWKSLHTAGAERVGTAALEAFRIAEGIPAYGIDIVERDLAQETSQLRALSFSKGCYLGQEIVERIRSRGNVHKHLRLLEISGPLPEAGAKLILQDAGVAESAVGHITSAAELPLAKETRTFALGMISAVAELRDQTLTYVAGNGTGTARILAGPPNLDANQTTHSIGNKGL
jgi:folate-binding protein YgfZ